MSPKKRRPENKPLPTRWRKKGNAYYYRVPAGQEHAWDNKTEFPLGRSLGEAHKNFSARVARYDDIKTMVHLADRYELEIVVDKAPATQKSNHRSIGFIRQVFAHSHVADVTPQDIYKFRDFVAQQKSKKQANLALEVLSHMFTKSIEWGIRGEHPMTDKKVVKFSLEARDRYVEDWELAEFLSVAGEFLNCYVDLKLLTGMDKADLLSIKKQESLKDDRLEVNKRRKTKRHANKRKRYFPHMHPATGESTGIEESVNRILATKRKVGSLYLFATRTGQPYIKEDGTTSGFDSIWQRAMKKALKETKLEVSFTEHDLRAKAASDEETDEEAQRLLDHSNPQMTRRTYRRKAVLTLPAKKKR